MNLLVAVDSSSESADALAYAIDIAEATDGSVTAAHAVDPAVYGRGGREPVSSLSDADQRLVIESIADAEQRGFDVLEDADERAHELGHDIETELLYGHPVGAITDYATREGFDGIVLGHRGRSERAGYLLGSVAKEVVERATLPVTVVR
jgi:nucleotide-binding universal stress UspA family protein